MSHGLLLMDLLHLLLHHVSKVGHVGRAQFHFINKILNGVSQNFLNVLLLLLLVRSVSFLDLLLDLMRLGSWKQSGDSRDVL